MQFFLEYDRNNSSKTSAKFRPTLAYWMAVLMVLARTPATVSQPVDCREVTGHIMVVDRLYDTCTVPLQLNETEAEMIKSLNVKYHEYPIRCRVGKYTVVSLEDLGDNGVIPSKCQKSPLASAFKMFSSSRDVTTVNFVAICTVVTATLYFQQ